MQESCKVQVHIYSKHQKNENIYEIAFFYIIIIHQKNENIYETAFFYSFL